MAGKHVGGMVNVNLQAPATTANLAAYRPAFPGSRVDRAYAEGRQIYKLGLASGLNPFTVPMPEYYAWLGGYINGVTNTLAAVAQTHNPQAY